MNDFNEEQHSYHEAQPNYVVQEVSQDEKTMAGLIPLLNLLGLFVVSIIIWVIKKDDMPFVDRTGKEFLNFIISITIYTVVAGILTIILIGLLLLLVIGVFAFVVSIIATIKAFNGEDYQYPLCIRLIK